MKFSAFRLNAKLLSNIEQMGFRKPTDIQYKAIRPILDGDDVLAIAQTGTGKTAAFAIPSIDILMRRQRREGYNGVRCIIMEPTHELAHQVGEVIERLANNSGLSVLAIYGGVDQAPQIAKLQRTVDILIATPGRLFDLASQGYLRTTGCEILVLDEADHMLDLGFIDDIRQLIKFLPKRRQTLFFSATIDEKIKKLAYSLVYKPVHIRISPKNMVSRNVVHTLLKVPMNEKRFYLERIYNENPECSVMVFARTRVRVERICAAMARVGIECVGMHGAKGQSERTKALNAFREGRIRMLIATDVTARGIDIPSVNYVVNYDVPDVAENYVHRVGRTGRGMDKGFAVTFCSPEEQDALDSVQDYIGGEIDELYMSYEDREATLDFSEDATYDWQGLINEEIAFEEGVGKKKKRKR